MSGQTGDQAGNEAEPNGKLRRLKRQPGGRTKVVWVRLSDREATVIKARAERAGVSVPRFLVESAVTGEQTVSERHALYRTLLATRRTVAGLANNVNQLARVANATGHVPAELGEMARALSGAAAALEESLGDLRSTPEVA